MWKNEAILLIVCSSYNTLIYARDKKWWREKAPESCAHCIVHPEKSALVKLALIGETQLLKSRPTNFTPSKTGDNVRKWRGSNPTTLLKLARVSFDPVKYVRERLQWEKSADVRSASLKMQPYTDIWGMGEKMQMGIWDAEWAYLEITVAESTTG